MTAGFIDLPAARMAVRRLKLRRALLDARGLIATALDRLDQVEQGQANAASAAREGFAGLGAGVLQRAGGGDAIDLRERGDVREHELLEGANLVLQFLNSLGFALGHGAFVSGCFDAQEANPASDAAHRLSGGGE